MYYILLKDIMQTMSFEKFVKKVFWFFGSSKWLEEFPDMVIFVDSEGYIVKANDRAESCFNLGINESVSVHIDKIIDDGMNVIQSSIDSGRPVVSTSVVEGAEFPVELNAAKKFGYYCVVIRDNSQLTRDINTSAKITMLNREKNELIVKLENEFVSPITSIMGFSKGLIDGIGGELSEKQLKYIKIINSNSSDLYDFISKFIEFSYSESSLCEVDSQKFDVIETIKNVMKDFDEFAKEKKLDFTLDYGILEKRTIFSDAKVLKTVLSNIIDVSVSNTDLGYVRIQLGLPTEDDFVNFGLRENKSYLSISINDSGNGFESSDMRSLCDPYAQLSKGKKEVMRAFKLGAASILIKRLNGYINVASEPLKGTTYNIVIPTEKGQK